MLKCKGAAQDLVHNVYDVLIDTFGDAMTEQMLESFKSHVFEAEKEIDKFIIELINDNSSPYNVTEIWDPETCTLTEAMIPVYLNNRKSIFKPLKSNIMNIDTKDIALRRMARRITQLEKEISFLRSTMGQEYKSKISQMTPTSWGKY